MFLKDPILSFGAPSIINADLSLVSARQGILMLNAIVKSFHLSNESFEISVSAVPDQSNGWGIEKINEKFIFFCLAEGEIGNFPHADFWVYRRLQSDCFQFYKVIEDDNLSLDENCFLTYYEVDIILSALIKQEFPIYNEENWTRPILLD